MPGPLAGVRVVELGGLGPAPHAAMVLGDLGADVVRVDRPKPGAPEPAVRDANERSRRSLALDLKDAADKDLLLQLIERADILLDPYRPGVMERLGLGPDVCQARNPRLIFGRMTGWGQEGPMAQRAGHDINYVSMTGVLWAIGRPGERPQPPLNLIGDFGGGSMLMLTGVLAALHERERSGLGQVIDVAMVDGTSLLAQFQWAYRGQGIWQDERYSNLTDGGSPWYDVYTCQDGGFFAVGAIEPQFYAQLLHGLGLADEDLPDQNDRSGWPRLRRRFEEVFASRTRDEWTAVFSGTDACATPVLSWAEAEADAHLTARGTLQVLDGVTQPAPAPRFSRTPAAPPSRPRLLGEDRDAVVRDWGISQHT